MSGQSLKVMELFSIDKYTILGASKLYNLEPIGLGTPLVEGFTGYISRSSQEHCLSLHDLFSKFIIPNFSYIKDDVEYHQKSAHIIRYSRQINGYLVLAKDWSVKFEELTGRSDLCWLTMILWEKVISFVDLLCAKRRWCPHCYEDWTRSGGFVYDPLIWSIAAVNMCGLHYVALIDRCPTCGKGSPPLTTYLRPGYCALCGAWLGLLQHYPVNDNAITNMPDGQWREFVWRSVSRLLTFRPTAAFYPRKDNISNAITWYSILSGKGVLSFLSRQIGISEAAVRQIHDRKNTSSLITM